MLRSWRAVVARFGALLRSDAVGVRAGFVALLLSSGGDLLAGLTLGSITGTLEALPGLLVIVTAAGDMVTLPALFLATYLVGVPWVTPLVAVMCAVAGLAALAVSIRAHERILRRIVRESVPVLALAGSIDIVAGLNIEKRFT